MATNSIIFWLKNFIAKHPAIEALDVYKVLYQKNFGPYHILGDISGAKARFNEEFDFIEPEQGCIFEPIDPDGKIFWLNLRQAKAEKIIPDAIWSALVRTGMSLIGKENRFREEWAQISKYLKNNDIAGEGIAELDSFAQKDNPPIVHHSTGFTEGENPSYRVVSAESVIEKGGRIAELFIEEKRRRLEENYSASVAVTVPDVQRDYPEHPIDIDRVGISDLSYPVEVLDKSQSMQSTVANIAMSVDLPAKWRGTHMSRFLEILNKYRGEMTYVQIRSMLESMLSEFEAKAAHFRMVLPYFIEKAAPVTGAKSLMLYSAMFDGELDRDGFRFKIGVKAPVTTLCPCSKELCEKSAHSQRTVIEIEALSPAFIWFEDLIELAESAASSPVYSLLKRPDEKKVTEDAYAKPRFVEDVARFLAKAFEQRQDIASYRVKVVSAESIHNHSAFAQISGGSGKRAFDSYYSSLDDDAYSAMF